MINFKIFEEVSNEEMYEMYKDILSNKEMVLPPRSLDSYARQLKEKCHFEKLSQATNFTVELFYEEIAQRFFKQIEASSDIKENE